MSRERVERILKIFRSCAPDSKFQSELVLVSSRICRVIPNDLAKRLFSSAASETGRVVRYPYCRMDSLIINGNILLDDLEVLLQNNSCVESMRFKTDYDKVCIFALKALLWIEVGFGGFEIYAHSKASKNWTSGVGHFLKDEDRINKLMSVGITQYKDFIRRFVSFRQRFQEEDCFSELDVEYLLTLS